MNNLTEQDKIRMKTLNKLIDELLSATEEETIEFANTHFELLEENESLKQANKELLDFVERVMRLNKSAKDHIAPQLFDIGQSLIQKSKS